MRALIAIAIVLACVPFPGALAAKLDDSPSPRQRIDVRTRWLHDGDNLSDPKLLNAMIADVANLDVRLNTAAYVGKRGRIYMAVPQLVPGLRSPEGMRIEWRTRGMFQPGSVLPGGRALLYDGLIEKPITGDILDVSIFLDARDTGAGLRFEPRFEIDLLP